MLEAQLQTNILQLARVSGLACYHTYNSRRSVKGWPDLVIVGSNAVLYRELKAADGRISPEQQFFLDALAESGQDVDVWRPEDWPDRIAAEMGRLHKVRAQRPLPSQADVRRQVGGRAKRRIVDTP